jgi:hypothetical protein
LRGPIFGGYIAGPGSYLDDIGAHDLFFLENLVQEFQRIIPL